MSDTSFEYKIPNFMACAPHSAHLSCFLNVAFSFFPRCTHRAMKMRNVNEIHAIGNEIVEVSEK